MTNDEYRQLVEFLGRHFTDIEQQFAGVNRRFEAIDRRFDGIEQRLDAHDERFREILGHLEAIYGRLERLEQEYYAIVEGLRRIEAILTDERARREVLERGLAELKERVALLQARIGEIERRLQA
jgi:chromosome segregation ATPase